MIRSVRTIWGVLMTEQMVVETAEETKSKAGPAKLTGNQEDSVLFVASKTAKARAPWGRERANWAPAPLVKIWTFKLASSPAPLVCNRVFTTLAGCMAVCAQERDTAPASMLPQNVRVLLTCKAGRVGGKGGGGGGGGAGGGFFSAPGSYKLKWLDLPK